MVEKTILKDTPENLIREFKQVLRSRNIPFEKVILYGSYAKGTPKPWSDLDLCVVSKIFGKNTYDEMVKLVQLATEVDPMIEPYPYHPRDLRNPYDPLAFEIRTHGKVV